MLHAKNYQNQPLFCGVIQKKWFHFRWPAVLTKYLVLMKKNRHNKINNAVILNIKTWCIFDLWWKIQQVQNSLQ